MKIITWNCQGSFRTKWKQISSFNPDIAVIQECESLEKFTKKWIHSFKTAVWFGENKNKGIGVFSNNFELKILDIHNSDFKTIIPISASKNNIEFILFAICANNTSTPKEKYIEQVWKAIHYYESMLDEKKIMLLGDFNSNSIWDKPKRIGNHTDVVRKLESKNIFSVYHTFYKTVHGKELHPTFYLYRHANKPYHLDYCFLSIELIQTLKNVEIGSFDNWIAYSDHSPIIIDF